eukprot:TRINITY_DN16391_c0_g1_i2.p1 TRINITY_DN16391_c0_g1~~TRINITY_DN16391_c0_g1_i2.p1  ORF type:complete len:315 (-),score=36.15 TRINITY_DN16391_c0_g1_i2:255-1199(-)
MPEGDRQQGNTAAAAQLPLPRVGAANGDGSRPLLGGVEGASSSSDVGESSRTNAEAPLVRSSSGSASIAPAEAATAVRDARGSTSLESRTARPCALMVQRLDQAILWYCRHQGWVPRTENPPEFAARQLRKLRLPVAACLFLTTAAVLMQLWCFFKGWLLLAFLGDAASAYCSELRHWLFGYCVALTMTPFCFAVVGPLVAWWAANGAVIRSNLPAADRCKANAPELWGFVDEALYEQRPAALGQHRSCDRGCDSQPLRRSTCSSSRRNRVLHMSRAGNPEGQKRHVADPPVRAQLPHRLSFGVVAASAPLPAV